MDKILVLTLSHLGVRWCDQAAHDFYIAVKFISQKQHTTMSLSNSSGDQKSGVVLSNPKLTFLQE